MHEYKIVNKIKYLLIIRGYKTKTDRIVRFVRLSRLLATLLLYLSTQSVAADFTFAAFGDAPYSESEEAPFVGLIAAMNREPLVFAIHVGDFKNGWSPCTDETFAQRRDGFALLHHPLIYTPGDNEWTDCWRAMGSPDAVRSPLDRLQQLRRLFFADGYSLGQRKIALARQSADYPEHARWQHGGVVFATLNVPGGDNNARMPHEAASRGRMIDAWITDTFRLARAQSNGAVVLAMQANPWTIGGNVRKTYSALLDTIARETQQFAGEVVLIHGDTHRYRIDQPLTDPRSGRSLRNFTRIEVFGSPAVNWVRVRVSRQNGVLHFSATPGNP
jgi:hypothetical protein